jgi:deoxyribose-phosphate aldolase
MGQLTRGTLAQKIDHTLLKADVTSVQIAKLCGEAREMGFFSVCINPSFVALAKSELQGSEVKVCTVIGFPLGASTSETKAFEATNAVKNGADELDMVINIGALKEGNVLLVKEDIARVVTASGGKTVKVILETCLLSDDEILRGCKAAEAANAHFVKTSTGFSTGGATVEAVRLMRKSVGPKMGVKASGGIKDYETLVKMVEAGANRIGTSSGVQLLGKGSVSEGAY